MIIALPSTDHNHLADALVRDLGFTRTHVDQPLRDLLLALDPYVDSGITLANMGPSPRLSSKLEQYGGWDRLLHPPQGAGAAPDRVATEVNRLLAALRAEMDPDFGSWPQGDIVLVGITTNQKADYAIVNGGKIAAIAGRAPWDSPDRGPRQIDYVITPAGVVGEQQAIVAYAQSLRQPARIVPVVIEEENGDLTDTGAVVDLDMAEQSAEVRDAASKRVLTDDATGPDDYSGLAGGPSTAILTMTNLPEHGENPPA